MLTTEEKSGLDAAFGEAGERIAELERGQTEAGSMLCEMRKLLKAVSTSTRMASDRAGEYKGFWQDDVQAREFGEFCLGVVSGKDMSRGGASDSRSHAMAQKAMSGDQGEAGGYLLPTDMAAWIIQKIGRYGKFRADALVVEMGARKLPVPRVSEDLTVYAPGEGSDLTASDIKVGMVELDAITLGCFTSITRELDQDSMAGMGNIIGLSIARALAKKEDEIGFMGDGTEQYFGMTGIIGGLRGISDTISEIAGLHVGTGNAYSELAMADFEAVVGLLPSDADDDAVWYMSKKFFWNTVHPLALTNGAGSDLWDLLAPTKARHFLGYPVKFPHCMPSVAANSQICAILGDLQLGAYLGQRKAVEIATSEHVYFPSNRLAFRGLERIDVNAHGVGDTSEAGPIVGLITAAA